jgi:uncharacterized protein YqjF (DUF2071 family)
MSFLKGSWENLVMANYITEPKILSAYIPNGTELDLWNGKCYVSLVGFLFKNTKLLGFKVPFHVNFEEVNLRFYVKRKENNKWKRGVVFIKELVPKWALSFVANTIYKEHYQTVPMKNHILITNDILNVCYEWQINNKWQSIEVSAEQECSLIEKESETEFITEHYWGYAKINDKRTNEYEVTHPRWVHHKIKDYKISVDFEKVYGTEFSFLNNSKPNSVILAKGSHITVEKRRKLSF